MQPSSCGMRVGPIRDALSSRFDGLSSCCDFILVHSQLRYFHAADVSSWGAGSSCPFFLQPFRCLFCRRTPDPRPGLWVGPPAGAGRPRARAGPGRFSGGDVLRAGQDYRASSRASSVPAWRCWPGWTGLNLDPALLPGFRRQAEAAAGHSCFGWPGSAHTVITPLGCGVSSVALCAC